MSRKKEIKLHVTPELHARISARASAIGISMNSVVVSLLHEHLPQDTTNPVHRDTNAKTDTKSTRQDNLPDNMTINTAQRLDKNVKGFIEHWANARPTMQWDIISSSECRITSMGKTVTANVKDQGAFQKKLMSLPEDLGEGFVYEYNTGEHTLTLPGGNEYAVYKTRQDCVDVVGTYKSMLAVGISKEVALKDAVGS